MDPIAFEAGPLTVRWYGIFAAAGFLAAFGLLMRRAHKLRILKPNQAADLAFFGIIGAILGARLLYVIENWGHFHQKFFQIFRIDQGGLVFYGGFAGAVATVVFVSRLRHYSVVSVADLFAPVIPLGHAIGRIGCFLNGCCFGRPWEEGIFAVEYPFQHYRHIADFQAQNGVVDPIVAVVPVQLLASAGNFLICALLLTYEKRNDHTRGELFVLYVVFYGIARFLTEFLRGDYLARPGGLTSAQWWCLAAVLAGAGFMGWLLHQKRSKTEVSG